MARLIQAMARYGPRVARKPTAQLDEVAKYMAKGTGLADSQVSMVLRELHGAILYFNATGTPVKLPGIGIFAVSVDRHGTRRLKFKADRALAGGLSPAQTRRLPIRNAGNIGLDNPGFKALWDADFPDDPLDLG